MRATRAYRHCATSRRTKSGRLDRAYSLQAPYWPQLATVGLADIRHLCLSTGWVSVDPIEVRVSVGVTQAKTLDTNVWLAWTLVNMSEFLFFCFWLQATHRPWQTVAKCFALFSVFSALFHLNSDLLKWIVYNSHIFSSNDRYTDHTDFIEFNNRTAHGLHYKIATGTYRQDPAIHKCTVDA